MAVAPNANIGLVAGTTPGIDPRFAQVFSRNKISGKYLDLNHNLANDLKNMGLWEKVKDRIIADQGDISAIDGIPQHIKDIYKTSFSTSPYAFIEVAARAQKWMDQALSRNMYLETRDIEETMEIYSTAWRKGLKSTYYLHMKPRHTAEQSTVKVNKAEKMGKRGFAAVFEAGAVAPMMAREEVLAEMPMATPAISTFIEETPKVTVAVAKAQVAEELRMTPALSQTSEVAPIIHANASPLTAPNIIPSGSLSKILPPSDPMMDNLCDGCQ
jgi:ribonucleoside-diphosphate reductase alpha chain